MEPTLHRLLWGPTSGRGLAEWAPRPWEIPAVGLPVRVATYLYVSAAQSDLPAKWSPEQGPLTWQILGQIDVIGAGRLGQFDLDQASAPDGRAPSEQKLVVRRTTDWEIAPHEAYFLPLAAAGDTAEVDRDDYALYCDVLLLITAVDGGESILTGLADRGLGAVPFVDRWHWRSRIHLPEPAWEAIDSILRWSTRPERTFGVGRKKLATALKCCRPETLTSDDFLRERVDIGLGDADSAEVPRTVRQAGILDACLPQNLHLTEAQLGDSLLVRVGQTLRKRVSDKCVFKSFPVVAQEASNAVLEQIASAFQAPHHASPVKRPDLAVFPELAVPQPEARTVRDLVAKTGIASLSGLHWRQLKPVYAARGSTRVARRWFVNEAELAVPVGHHDPGPTSVRWYRVRKPLPAHVETGLASALSCRDREKEGGESGDGVRWAMLRGRRWYRFLHPAWGDFTIAICADLLDAAPWQSLKGEFMHLFMVAFNRDVDLFDALTWVRSYENFANVVTVNEGRHGGSVIWTPRRRHRRELGHMRGGDLFVIADVRVPVKSLFQQQRRGVGEAELLSSKKWQGLSHGQEKATCFSCGEDEFKAPPPGYERRAFMDDTEEALRKGPGGSGQARVSELARGDAT